MNLDAGINTVTFLFLAKGHLNEFVRFTEKESHASVLLLLYSAL